MNYRIETDSIGEIQVPAEHYWGSQTQRSQRNFAIGTEKIPLSLIKALALIKFAAAKVNTSNKVLTKEIGDTICQAAQEILQNKLFTEFPLSVWQTGSGTHTNMNVNEVIANRANELLGYEKGKKYPVHPNDHVNCGQSSNDTFPTAMHIATARAIHDELLPAMQELHTCLQEKSTEFMQIVKIARTHLQDAVPITLGQEFSGYTAQLQHAISNVRDTLTHIYELAQGGTAVGTGLNSKPGFAEAFAHEIAELTSLPFTSGINKFALLASHDALVQVSSSLNLLASILMKIANDIRLLASGPRCGLGELFLPVNEPGSSIMPGKVNPTQCEALTMVCAQVMGNHLTVTISNASGQLDLNVFNPVIIYNILQAITLLTDGMNSFCKNCLTGVRANEQRIAKYVHNSLMLVTALNPVLGYDKAAQIAKLAYKENLTLREAVHKLGFLSFAEFDSLVQAQNMLCPK